MCYIMETVCVGRADLKEEATQIKINVQYRKHKDKQSKKRGNLSEWTDHKHIQYNVVSFQVQEEGRHVLI